MLDRYLYWLLRSSRTFMTAEGMVHGGINDDRGYRLSLQWQWRQWMVAFEESFEPTNYPWFTSLDEVDPLHLARNGGEAGVADPLAYLSVLPVLTPTENRATSAN